MSGSPRKSISKLVRIWTFLLLLIIKGGFPKPAYAQLITPPPTTSTPIAPVPALSSLGACFRDPKCAAVLLLGGGANGATVHYFNEANKQQVQDKARQKYCLVYPTDWVCHGQMPGVKYRVIVDIFYEYPDWIISNNRWIVVFKPYTYHYDTINDYEGAKPIGPISAIHIESQLLPQYGNIWGNIYYSWVTAEYHSWRLVLKSGNPNRSPISISQGGLWVRPGQPPKIKNLQIFPEDGRPDTGGSFPWLSWPHEKQEQALKL